MRLINKIILAELVENPRLAEITSGTKSAGRALVVSTNFTDCGELKTMNSPFPRAEKIENSLNLFIKGEHLVGKEAASAGTKLFLVLFFGDFRRNSYVKG